MFVMSSVKHRNMNKMNKYFLNDHTKSDIPKTKTHLIFFQLCSNKVFFRTLFNFT